MSNIENYANLSHEAHVWEQGWEDHSRHQLDRIAALPLSEKLAWLEEAHRLILHLQKESS